MQENRKQNRYQSKKITLLKLILELKGALLKLQTEQEEEFPEMAWLEKTCMSNFPPPTLFPLTPRHTMDCKR